MKKYWGVLFLFVLPSFTLAWEDRPPELNLDHYADPPRVVRPGPRFDGDLLGSGEYPLGEVRKHSGKYMSIPEEGWHLVYPGPKWMYFDRAQGWRRNP